MESIPQSPEHHSPFVPLPIYLTRFVGREHECATLTSLVQNKRLLTLTGAGGIGKTRLALQVAAGLESSFPDGVCLVELASLSEPQLVPHALALALTLRTDHDDARLTLLVSTLRERHLLLLLDTCEHVLSTCAPLVETLLQACPFLHILATSREPLHISGETIWRVDALSSPHPEHMPPFEQLSRYEAVQLFCERATDVDSRFHLTPHNASAIVRICHHLDGLPLALELAIARLPMLSAEHIASHLGERFALLTRGKRTAPSRQQTLEATLEWSYTLLSPAEQALFPCLAVFAGSWNLEAVEQVCVSANIGGYPMFDVLAQLVNKSLVLAEEQEGGVGEVRYRLLDTMRHYALQKVQQIGNWHDLSRQHFEWYLHLAELANDHIQGEGQFEWLQRMDIEQANCRAALTQAFELGQLDALAHLADALRRFWITRNAFGEGRHWFETLLAAERANTQLSLPLKARVLFGAAEFARYQGAYEQAQALLEEQMELLRTLDDTFGLAEAQAYLGLIVGLRGDYEQAIQLGQASLDFYRDAGHNVGNTTTLITLAFMALAKGDSLHALALSEEACRGLRETGNYTHLLYALFTVAQAALFQEDGERACTACQEALHLAQALGQTYGIASSLGLIGGLANLEGRPIQAARLFGAAHSLQERVQTPHPPAGRALQERMLLSIRATLGKEQFLLHYAAGQVCPLEQMLLEAETIFHSSSAHSGADASMSRSTPLVSSPALVALSRREREILVLVATSLTDAQIAQHLLLSPRTVSKHLQSIYTKLNINSRSAATRLALEHDLV